MEYQVGEYVINETTDDEYQVGELMLNEDQGGVAFDPANGFPYDQLLIPYFRRTDVVAI